MLHLVKLYLLHGSGTGTTNLTSFIGHAKTNSWHGTANLIGVHGMAENIQDGGTMVSKVTGLKGEAIGSTLGNGSSTAIGGHFKASGADNNYASIFESGNVGIGTLTPNATLHLVGTLKLENLTTNANNETSALFLNSSNMVTTRTLNDVAFNGYTETQTLSTVIGLGNSAGNNKITDLSDPTENQDAATKKYVDDNVTQSLSDGTQSGQMLYWNGTDWVTVAFTQFEGATLQMIGGTITVPPSVTNPTTGETWLPYNLGASRVATSSTDVNAYGDYYQWGRGTDGHEKSNSSTTLNLSNSDTPGHGNFIRGSDDWRSPQNNNLWQGESGTNNPCPSGYRIPTEAEWEAERQSWSSNNAAGAFNSPLKLTTPGYRHYTGGNYRGNR